MRHKKIQRIKRILAAYKKNDMKKVRKLSKNLPAMANEKCVKKMKSKYKKSITKSNR